MAAGLTDKEKKFYARLVGGFVAVVGLGLLVFGIADGVSRQRFVATAARATGVVTGFETTLSKSPPTEIQFTAADGQVVRYVQGGAVSDGYGVGDKVALLYNPRRPASTACLDTPDALWGDMRASCLAGSVFLALGLFCAYKSQAFYVR